MVKSKFVYVTYIATTPEKLWQALTDAEMTRQYWGNRVNASDWNVGSQWQHRDYDDASKLDLVGKVVEHSPPRRLVLTWAAAAHNADAAKHSRVSFDIEPVAEAVRLTVTHDDLEPGSDMERGITKGWPFVLSSLKTMLETGKAMAMTRDRSARPA